MKRRGLFGVFAAAVATAFLPRRVRAAAPVLRPPGALAPGAFEEACIGCFRCAEVCPPKAIRFSGALSLETALPYIDASLRACVLCMKCTQVCPTDALLPIAALPETVFSAVRMGVPKLEREKCLPWNGRGVCRLCFYVCPYPDRAVELVGPQQAPLFHADACVGCGLCEEACPKEAQAIKIMPLGLSEPHPGKGHK